MKGLRTGLMNRFRRRRSRQKAYRRISRRRVLIEHLETRHLLASLIGVDFDPTGQAPTNWTGVASTNFPLTLTDLVDESGASTSIDLQISSQLQATLASQSFSNVPSHSQPLTRVDGVLSAYQGIEFTYSDLEPLHRYEVYVFGRRPSNHANSVGIEGDYSFSFSQWDPSTTASLLLNREISTFSDLSQFMETAVADENGQLTISVGVGAQSTGYAAALAIKEIGPSSERTYALRGTGNSLTITEFDPLTLNELRSFAAPTTVSQVGPQGLAVGPDSLFFIDGNASGPNARRLYELDLNTGAEIDSDVVPTSNDISGLAYLDGLVYMAIPGSLIVWDPAADAISTTFNVGQPILGGVTGAADRGVLFAADTSFRVHEVNPATGAVTRTFGPFGRIYDGGLAYFDGEIVASTYGDPGVAWRIDATTGSDVGGGPIDLPGSGFLAGLGGDGARPPVVAVERLYAIRGTSGATPTIYELDPVTLDQVNSFPGPEAVVTIGYQGLAVGPDSLFYMDGTPNNLGPLYELDLDTGAVLDSDALSGQYDISGIGYLDGLVYIEDRNQTNEIIVWNPDSDAIQSTFSTPATVVGGLTGAADRNALYMNTLNGAIHAVDPATGNSLGTVDPNPSVPTLSGGLAYINGRLLGAPYGTSGAAYWIDPSTGNSSQVTLPGSGYLSGLASDGVQPSAPTQTSTTEDLYAVRNSDTGVHIDRIDAADGSILSSFSVPRLNNDALGPQGLAVGPNSLFYIDGLQNWPHFLYELDPDTGGIIDVDLVDQSLAFKGAAYLNGRVYLEKEFGQILVWNPDTDVVEATLNIAGSNNHALAASPAGELFVANGDSAVIRRLDPDTGATLDTWSHGLGNIHGLAFYDGELLASTTENPAKIYRLDPQTGAVIDNFTVAGTPSQISALGGDGVVTVGNAPLTLTIADTSLREPPSTAQSTTATVRRHGGDNSQAMTVSLSSNDTTEATVPSTVTIAPGQDEAQFTITAADDTLLDGKRFAFIDAAINPTAVGSDATFGTSGLATASLGEQSFSADYRALGMDAAVLTDGKILTLGDAGSGTVAWRLQRFLPDGSLDTSFGTNGVLTQTSIPPASPGGSSTALAVLDDGSFVVSGRRPSGTSRDVLTKYDSNGQLDTGFGSDGFAEDAEADLLFADVLIEPDGSIVVAGSALEQTRSRIMPVRFSSQGTVQAAFPSIDESPGVIEATNLARQPDGKLLVAGRRGAEFFVARYTATNALDTAFSGDGKQTVSFAGSPSTAMANAVHLLPDGKILLAGFVQFGNETTGDWAVARLNPDGTLDTSFSDDGLQVFDVGGGADYLHDLLVQQDGKLILAGSATMGGNEDLALARLSSQGIPDTTFDGDGLFITSIGITGQTIYDAQLQRNGKVVALAGADNDVRVARFNSATAQTARGVVEVRDTEDIRVDVSPSAVSENGGTATGTVSVTNTDRGSNLTVSLSSNDTSEATVPDTVTIPANQQSTTFTITAVDDAILDGTRTVYIYASASGYTQAQAGVLAVLDDEATPLSLDAVDPLGSLIYDPPANGDIGVTGEVDRYSVSVDPGQTLSVVLRTDSALAGKVEVYSPTDALLSGASASSAGDTLLLQAVPAAAGGKRKVPPTY